MAKKVMSGVAAASIIANVAIAPSPSPPARSRSSTASPTPPSSPPTEPSRFSGPVLSEIADLSAEDLYAQRKAKDYAAAAKKKAAAPAAKKATAAPAKKRATGPAKEGLTLQAGDVSAYDQLAGTPPAERRGVQKVKAQAPRREAGSQAQASARAQARARAGIPQTVSTPKASLAGPKKAPAKTGLTLKTRRRRGLRRAHRSGAQARGTQARAQETEVREARQG